MSIMAEHDRKSGRGSTKRKRRRANVPEEIIVKFSYFIDGTAQKYFPVFELLMLADEQGYKSLSRYFARRARRAREWTRKKYTHDDHDHLSWSSQLSDRMEIRTDCLTKFNRKELLKRYGISASSRRIGSMAGHLRALASEAEKQAANEQRFMKKNGQQAQMRKGKAT